MELMDRNVPFSTGFSSCLFQIISKDYFNQTSIGENLFQALQIEHNSEYTLDFTIHNYFLCFSAIRPNSSKSLTNIAGKTLMLEMNSSELVKNLSRISRNNELKVKLKVRNCIRGEYFDLEQLKCVVCQPNFYSFEDDFVEPSSCKSCTIERRFYCYGGFNLTPKAGYWRRTSNSFNFMKCPYESGN
jgi:hypothetical protein